MEKIRISAAERGNLADSQRNETHVSECAYPKSTSCRGCPHSYRPDLSDGGCRLHYAKA